MMPLYILKGNNSFSSTSSCSCSSNSSSSGSSSSSSSSSSISSNTSIFILPYRFSSFLVRLHEMHIRTNKRSKTNEST